MSIAATIGALGQVAMALSPWAPAPKPRTVAEVDQGWLGNVLAAGTPGARIIAMEDRGGTSGTTDRRRLALTWNEAGAEAGLPASLFLKATSPSPKNRTMVAALWMATNEVKFYDQVRPSLGEIAPIAHHAQASHGARFMLVLEDLLERGAEPIMSGEAATVGHAGALMDVFAELHAAYWCSPRLKADLSWVAPMTGRPGFSLLASQFRRTRRKFLAQADQRGLSPRVRRMLELLNADDIALYRTWEDGPQTLVHGDSHVGNTYALPDGRAGLLDWQVIFSTRGMRELTYFMIGGLDVDTRRANEKALIQRYLDGLATHGVAEPPTFEEAWADYRYFVHDSWDSVALTILWAGLHPAEALAEGLRRASTAVEDLATDEIVAERVAALP
ncbi:MAG TPA: phosphotransferase [Acidimicrobiales bacterium]|nr:phosphotransferase [Acidimicrobiales bacterium]